MPRTSQIMTGIILVFLTIVCLDAAIDLWPAIGVQSDVCGYVQSLSGPEKSEYTQAIKQAYKISCKTANTPVTRVNVEGLRMALSPDQALFAVVALFAVLGGLLQSFLGMFTGLAAHPARPPSLVWQVVRPFAAIVPAMIVYVVLRALFLPQSNLATANPFAFIAIAAVIGFFIDTILLWLKSTGLFVVGRK